MIEKTEAGIFFVAGHWPLDEAKPTLVLIHGSGGSHILWDKQVDALSPFANTLALDLPGHGRSPGKAHDTIAAYADGLHQFMEFLSIPHPIPCGLSIGGAIALQLLIDKKRPYEGGILVNTGARLKVMPMIFDSIQKDYMASVEATKLFAISEKTDPQKVEPLISAMRECKPESAYRDFKACDAFDVMAQLSAIDVPVLVMTAEDDKLTPPKYGSYLAQFISRSSAVQIAAAGHFSPLEKEAEVNRAIIDFLGRIGFTK